MQNKEFLQKVFSEKRMQRYFDAHDDEKMAMLHYQFNIELTESFYTVIAVYEVALRNAINKQLIHLFNREDWYSQFQNTPGLTNLHRYISQANKQISGRKELASPSKIVAELTLGFWVTLLNSEYEKILFKNLRFAFPNMPKAIRQRKNISAPLNKFRTFRNRVFHHEPICWNLEKIMEIHAEMILVMGWINSDIPTWIYSFDKVNAVVNKIETEMSWKTR